MSDKWMSIVFYYIFLVSLKKQIYLPGNLLHDFNLNAKKKISKRYINYDEWI